MMMLMQGLHVLFGVIWFGGAVFSNFAVMPAVNQLQPKQQKAFNQALAKYTIRIMTISATLTIVFGIILGFYLGAWNNLDSQYGVTYLLAIVVSLVLYFWGMLVLGPTANKLESLEVGSQEFIATAQRLKTLALAELGGFAIIFVLMVALRFGY